MALPLLLKIPVPQHKKKMNPELNEEMKLRV